MSAHVLSYALFETTDASTGLPYGYWPTPYHTVPVSEDNLLLGWDVAPCPVIQLLNNENQHGREIKQVDCFAMV